MDTENCIIAIDFDGTVTDVDIIDAVLQKFANPEWREVEAMWEQDIIGSRQCLERQMMMVDQPLRRLLDYIDGFSIDETFGDFARFLLRQDIPFAVISDGFQVFIERLLSNAGLRDIPVLANLLLEQEGKLTTLFPYEDPDCKSANCKCMAASELGKERSLVLIGDGRSDFCLAHRADHVFSKKSLTGYCSVNKIPHTPFCSFAEVERFLRNETAHALSTSSFASRKD